MLGDLRQPLITVRHCPACFQRRAGDLTANVCGTFARHVSVAHYRLNGGKAIPLGSIQPRIPSPLFTIELAAETLRPGRNELCIEATSRFGGSASKCFSFEYDARIPTLPGDIAPEHLDLDVQDGHWEARPVAGGFCLGPVRGTEGYDRILNLVGTFPGAREVSVEVIFRRVLTAGKPFGFGILPLWGGRPDVSGYTPRRGWNFSSAWYYSFFGGVGMDFSYKHGDAEPEWVAAYRNLTLEAGRPYRIRCQVWPMLTETGHTGYRQRMKWWPADAAEPGDWLELLNRPGALMPPGEYSTALIAHCCQVDFSRPHVAPLKQTV
jgi:hypothetical protein